MTADVAASERQALYATRSCLFVTTRILVVRCLPICTSLVPWQGRLSSAMAAVLVPAGL